MFPVGTVEQLSEYISRVRRHAEDSGRDPSQLDLAYSAGWYDDSEAQRLPTGERRVFTGKPQQIADDIKSFEAQGVRHLRWNMQSDTLDGSLARMERFAANGKPPAA